MMFQVFTSAAVEGAESFTLTGERTLVGTFEAPFPGAAPKAAMTLLLAHNLPFTGTYGEVDVPCTCAHILMSGQLAIVVRV